MADKTTVRILFALAATFNIHIENIDIKAAYLHEKVVQSGSSAVYVRQHWRFDGTFKHPYQVGKLNKNIYGTPGAGHTYLRAVVKLLHKQTFVQAEADMCIFHRRMQNHIIILTVRMNDFTFISTSKTLQIKFAAILKMTYNIKKLGEPAQVLG